MGDILDQDPGGKTAEIKPVSKVETELEEKNIFRVL